MSISYKLEQFEGPLDLLLHLIEKNKVSIYDIPIAEITDQYLEYVSQMEREDLNVVSEFLVMAATLLDIKSRMLLPKEKDEEAKDALEACDWDLLDAMVWLEKRGKVKGPTKESFTTSYEEQDQYVSVKDKVQEQEESGSDSFFKKLGHFCKILFQKSLDNSFYVNRREEEIFHVPVWALVLLLLFFWKILIPVMIVALFFECRYSFKGKDNLDGVNKAMDKAGDLADKVKDEYEKL